MEENSSINNLEKSNQVKKEENGNKKIELTYYQARFTQKCGAILLDFVLFAILALGLFIGTKAIVESTTYYQEINQRYDEARLNSSLYIDNNSVERVEDIVTYLNRDASLSSIEKEEFLLDHIFSFFDSLPEHKDYLLDEFYDFILDEDLIYEGNPYYVKKDGEIIKNDNVSIPSSAYYENVLAPYFDNIALAEFTILTPNVLEYQRYQSNMLLFVEIPVGILLSVIIIWYIIPLCFFRGKKSLGRLAFHIGLLGPDNFSLKAGRFTIRFLIFFFAEVVLSVFTFCIPLVISISMSAFSKNKQNFHDYMVGVREIDTYNSKIYLDKFDVVKKDNLGKTVDFQTK